MKKHFKLILSSIVILSMSCIRFDSNDESILNTFMDEWHNDVAEFNIENYFGVMDDSFIFLGTDPKERWSKKEFYKFCKPYFDRKRTWIFKKNWRNWYYSDDGKTVWFEESISTQMEECRGSGVLTYKLGKWFLMHYNLSVVIENEKMTEFIELRKSELKD